MTDAEWTITIREKHNFICWPSLKGCSMTATETHHIINRGDQNFRYDLDNGVPVCRSCHNKVELDSQMLFELLQRLAPKWWVRLSAKYEKCYGRRLG